MTPPRPVGAPQRPQAGWWQYPFYNGNAPSNTPWRIENPTVNLICRHVFTIGGILIDVVLLRRHPSLGVLDGVLGGG
mgnify:FL=1